MEDVEEKDSQWKKACMMFFSATTSAQRDWCSKPRIERGNTNSLKKVDISKADAVPPSFV